MNNQTITEFPEDNIHNMQSNVTKNVENGLTGIEKLTMDRHKGTSINEETCSNIDNKQLKNIKTPDKADANLGLSIENCVSVSTEPNPVTKCLEKLNPVDNIDKESLSDTDIQLEIYNFDSIPMIANAEMEPFTTSSSPHQPEEFHVNTDEDMIFPEDNWYAEMQPQLEKMRADIDKLCRDALKGDSRIDENCFNNEIDFNEDLD